MTMSIVWAISRRARLWAQLQPRFQSRHTSSKRALTRACISSQVVSDIRPEPELRADYIERNPVTTVVQVAPELGEHEVRAYPSHTGSPVPFTGFSLQPVLQAELFWCWKWTGGEAGARQAVGEGDGWCGALGTARGPVTTPRLARSDAS